MMCSNSYRGTSLHRSFACNVLQPGGTAGTLCPLQGGTLQEIPMNHRLGRLPSRSPELRGHHRKLRSFQRGKSKKKGVLLLNTMTL